MNGKRMACIVLSFLIGSSMTSFADIPKGTVVIDNKAYDLKYANKEKNLKEIYTQFKNSELGVYIKGSNGRWYDNSTEKEISKELIPKVTYKNENGKVVDYSAGDGVEIDLAVEKVSFLNDKQVKIQFNKKMMKESVLNKSNYKISESPLDENDIIDLKEDGKTVVITFGDNVEGKTFDTSIFISEKILDINNNSMKNSLTKNIIVINDTEEKLDKEINKDINIVVDGYNLKSMRINGDVYINANNVKIDKIVSTGNIIINEGENRKTEILNSDFKKVDVLSSGDESIVLNSIKADTLTLNSKEVVNITSKGNTKIKKSLIKNTATLELISGSLGEVTINVDKEKEIDSLVEFKGKFKDSIIMKSGAKLNILQGAEINKLVVRPISKDSTVNVEGAVKNIEVNRECVLNILKKANITNEIVVKCKSTINGEKGAKVNKLKLSPINNVDMINISGEFKNIEIIEEANIQFCEKTVVYKLTAYKNAVLNGDNTVKIKKIQVDKDVEVKKEDNDKNKEFKLPNIKSIEKERSSTSTHSGRSSSNSSGGGGNTSTISNSKPEAKAVSISGGLKVGQQMIGNYEFYDKDSDKEGSSIFKWYRADDMKGTNKTEISNESGKTYMLKNSDVGKYISFEVTPLAEKGEINGSSVRSTFIGPVEEVVVEDTEKPVITLNGSKIIELEEGTVYVDAGATAVDNKDGDITNNIVKTITDKEGNVVEKVDTTTAGEYTIHYNVTDEAGNAADEVTRIVIVNDKEEPKPEPDTEKPVITLNGSKIIEIEEGTVYVDAGATAVDNKDGDVTDKIVMTITDKEGNVVEKVDTTSAGEYTIHYNVTDEAGNAADEVTRTVIVNEKAEEGIVRVEVDGYNVRVIVESESLKDSISMRIINKETGDVEDTQTKYSTENKVVFERRIEKVGEFIVYVNAIKNGCIIEKTFAIEGEEPSGDTTKPVITLKGNSYVELDIQDEYVDAGATALDNVDGDVTDKIVMTITDKQGNVVEKVDTTTEREYAIHYNVSDKAGNKADEVTRIVVVKEKEVPNDGPVTIEVDGYNVKITVEGEDLKHSVSIVVINKITGELEDIQEKVSTGNKVIFERRIEKNGQYVAVIKAFMNGEVIKKDFSISE